MGGTWSDTSSGIGDNFLNCITVTQNIARLIKILDCISEEKLARSCSSQSGWRRIHSPCDPKGRAFHDCLYILITFLRSIPNQETNRRSESLNHSKVVCWSCYIGWLELVLRIEFHKNSWIITLHYCYENFEPRNFYLADRFIVTLGIDFTIWTEMCLIVFL